MRLSLHAIALALALMAPLQLQAVLLIYNNDVLGELEPCGCKNNPQGGWDRKYKFVKSLNDQEIVQLDSGNLFFESTSLPASLAPQAKLQAEYAVQMMNLMETDAVVPGPNDFALGLETFDQLKKKAKFIFLGANLKSTKKSPTLRDHIIITKKDSSRPLRIGVFGLLGPQEKYPSHFEFEDPIVSAKSQVKALKKKQADLIIALTHQGLKEDQKLAQEVTGIDLIIGGASASFLQQPLQQGKTTLFQALYRNRWVGKVKLKKPFQVEEHQLVNLDNQYAPEGPELKSNPMVALLEQFKKDVALLNLQAQRQDARLALEGAASKNKIQSFASCFTCHLDQFEFWRKTRHFNALEPLHKGGQLANKDCLRCHTVGFAQPNGWNQLHQIAKDQEDKMIPLEQLNQLFSQVHRAQSLNTPSQEKGKTLEEQIHHIKFSLAPIQCENCHGPGGDHPFSGKMSKKVSNTVCFSCHNRERSPQWYDSQGKAKGALIAEKIKQVACPTSN